MEEQQVTLILEGCNKVMALAKTLVKEEQL